MNEEFYKFKKKILKEHLLKSMLIGLSSSAILVSLFSILFKLVSLKIHFLIYVLSFVVLSLVIVTIYYKFNMPTDKEVARRLDNTFALKEKVETMVTYSDKDNEILKMQKDDTQAILKDIPTKKLPFKFSTLHYGGILIAIFFVMGSCIIPSSKGDTHPGHNSIPDIGEVPGSDNTPGSGTGDGGDGSGDSQSDDTTLNDLIDNSDAEEKVKEGIKEVLSQLMEDLKNCTTKEEKEEAINKAIEGIDKVVDDANSKEEIGEALTKEPNLNLNDLGYALIYGNIDGINSALENLEQEFIDLSDEELIEDLENIASQIENALNESGVEEDDELYIAFKHLMDGLNDIANTLRNDDLSENDIKDMIHAVIEKAKEEIIQDVTIQNNNQELGDLIKEILKDLLEDPESDGDDDSEDGDKDGEDENPNDKEDDDGEKPDDGEEDENQPDVGGDGDTIYGSNDSIYSDTGHSEYGDVLDDYYDKVMDEEAKGETPDDIDDILGNYFGSLYH